MTWLIIEFAWSESTLDVRFTSPESAGKAFNVMTEALSRNERLLVLPGRVPSVVVVLDYVRAFYLAPKGRKWWRFGR